MKHLSFVALALVACAHTYAPARVVVSVHPVAAPGLHVRVIDRVHGDPVVAATVQLDGRSATVDSDGGVTFIDVSAGPHRLVVEGGSRYAGTIAVPAVGAEVTVSVEPYHTELITAER